MAVGSERGGEGETHAVLDQVQGTVYCIPTLMLCHICAVTLFSFFFQLDCVDHLCTF
jgi:hypothetical protein